MRAKIAVVSALCALLLQTTNAPRKPPIGFYLQSARLEQYPTSGDDSPRIGEIELEKARAVLVERKLLGKDSILAPVHTAAYAILVPPNAKRFVYLFGEEHRSRTCKNNEYRALEQLIRNRDITLLGVEGLQGRMEKTGQVDDSSSVGRRIAEAYSCPQSPCVTVEGIDDTELNRLNADSITAQMDFPADIRSVKAALRISQFPDKKAAIVYGGAHLYLLQASLGALGIASVSLTTDGMERTDEQSRKAYNEGITKMRSSKPSSAWLMLPRQ